MNEFYEKAIERLRDDKGLSGNKERAMAPAVREALEKRISIYSPCCILNYSLKDIR